MHVASLSFFQSDLRHQIVSHTAKDEMYVQIKDKLKQQSLEKRYKGYKLEEDGHLTYKNIIYIPNVADLRRVVMDEIHQAPHILVTQDIRKQFLQPKSSIFGHD